MHEAWLWLGRPLSGAGDHRIAGWVAWHARLMVLAWNVVLPVGAMVARFGKVPNRRAWPKRLDDQRWWQAHRWGQGAGLAVMALGLAIAWLHARGGTRLVAVHHVLGWAICAVGAAQLVAGLLRGSKGGPHDGAVLRGDHYDMTTRRVLFEWTHKTLGWAVFPLVWLETGIGLELADAPRWMPLVLGLWWVALLVLFAALQRAGFCVDTYQAIWGGGAEHPGNARRPIGFGIRR